MNMLITKGSILSYNHFSCSPGKDESLSITKDQSVTHATVIQLVECLHTGHHIYIFSPISSISSIPSDLDVAVWMIIYFLISNHTKTH